MASFRLSRKTMLRLQAKFQDFQLARQTVRENIESYINSYHNLTESPS